MDIDIETIRRVIAEADVFVVRFAMIEQRLLVDTRPDGEGRPFISMVPPVNSAEERYRFMRQQRPDVPPPDRITVFQWPRQIAVMREVGVWRFIEDRVVSIGGEASRRAAESAFREGQRLERADVVAAIRGGEGYETIWERSR
ncbi:MAG: hypothetical protein O2822_07090 [Chloroflexi bacterium]|nr:hypothetical protein [Chloroflexota bacterium]